MSPVDGDPVELAGVTRCFGRRTALADVDLRVSSGEILGLAGPNGSGKTTLLKLLGGLLRPTRGRVRVLGHDPWREREAVMRAARFAFAPPALYGALSAREHLEHLVRLTGAAPSRIEIDRALELVGLVERGADRVHTFSFGMRQRLVLAQALLPEPRLLVLDEPADGLDPLAVLELRAILARLRAERGVTIVLSSHLLIELDVLVDRLLVLQEGRVLFHGRPEELRGEREVVRLRAPDPARAAALLEAASIAVCREADALVLSAESAPSLERARALLAAGGVELTEYARERPSLERALIARLEQRGRPAR